jgi:hypothetical protein
MKLKIHVRAHTDNMEIREQEFDCDLVNSASLNDVSKLLEFEILLNSITKSRFHFSLINELFLPGEIHKVQVDCVFKDDVECVGEERTQFQYENVGDTPDGFLGNCKKCGTNGILIEDHNCDVRESTSGFAMDFVAEFQKRYNNIQKDPDGNFTGYCVKCRCSKVDIINHSCKTGD